MSGIFRKIKEKKAKEFYEGIYKKSYEYSNKSLAACIKERGSFDELIAHDSEIIGRALQAEMDKKGKKISSGMYNSVRNNFLKLRTDNIEYNNVADSYTHAGDKAICKYLIATWKWGDELGHAIGLNNQEILMIKNAVKDVYMPQNSGHVQTETREM